MPDPIPDLSSLPIGLKDPIIQRFLSLARHYGQDYVKLAMHAAVPLRLTPELVHLLRINFVTTSTSNPWVLEADLLLSPLCEEVVDGFYQIDSEMRQFLLDALRYEPGMGIERIRRVAAFLATYTWRKLRTEPPREYRDFLLAQYFAGMAYHDPKKTAKILATNLKTKLQAGDGQGEILRFAALTQALKEPLYQERKLVLYTAGLERLSEGDNTGVRQMQELLGTEDEPVLIADVELPSLSELLPDQRTNREPISLSYHEEQNVDYLYEAKLLIVGEAGSGKTTLARRILDAAAALPEEGDFTKDIAVASWWFPLDNDRMFRVNIWDFGGQEIYHFTHQFFLTKRSLYVLVADVRRTDTDFYWWLNTVELLSDNSPVFIVKNEKDDRFFQLDEGALRGRFANLKEVLSANLANNRGLDRILDTIRYYMSQLPHVGTALPKFWVKVRAALENDPRNHITLGEYLDICEQHGFKHREDMLQLSGYLHDLGVCLHFQDDDLLMKTVILKPEWGTTAVYKVLDNNEVRHNFGCFSRADLANIWREDEYTGMHGELLRLMMNFKLCYELEEPGQYIAPQLLSRQRPDYDWETRDNLLLRYTYQFIPKGILTRFIVVMHRHIAEQRQCVWKSGVVLERDDTRAEIVEDYDPREIRIRVAGRFKRDLLRDIRKEFEKIHDSFHQLQYEELIPCGCEAHQDDPEYFKFKVLQNALAKGRTEIQCQKCFEMIEVRPLVDDVLPEVFISYAWDEESKRIVNELEQALQARHLTIVGHNHRFSHSNQQISDLGMQNQLAIEPTEMRNGKPVIRYFVFYAHDDKVLKDKLLKSLEQRLKIARDFCFEAWDDGEILAGERWHEQIQAAVARCHFGLLLVSPAFLGSAYIKDHELPAFVASNLAAPKPEKQVIPVAIKRIPFDNSMNLKGLEQRQVFHDRAGKTFQERSGKPKTREDFASELFQQILKIVKRHGAHPHLTEFEPYVGTSQNDDQGPIVRDKQNLGYKDSIREFMQRIGKERYVIAIISDKYLKSENCMFELLEIAKHGDFYRRIFPIILNDANIYRPINRIGYLKHWEDKAKELDQAMKESNIANLQGIRESIDLYTKIREMIARLTDTLKDMNTLTPEMHESSGFEALYRELEKSLRNDGYPVSDSE